MTQRKRLANEVELYVDNRDIDWRHDKRWMDEPVKPLEFAEIVPSDDLESIPGEPGNS